VGDSIVAMVILADDQEKKSTFVGKQGKFDFLLDLPEPAHVYLLEPGALRGDRNAAVYHIPGVPGEDVLVTATDRSRYDINGSKFYSQFHEADIIIETAQKEGKDATQVIYDFIKAHPDYETSAYLITMMRDPEKMKEAVGLLNPDVRDGRLKPIYQSLLDRIDAQMKAEEEAAKKQATGVEAPDFTLKDLEGKPLSLKSLRGKYVILDFWGSWCVWCIRGIPQMKEYYQKYAGKFEILGIDCNDTDEKWRDAVKKHELPWLHVYNPRESNVLEDYGIQGFPTKIIVGPDGKIVKTIVGEDPSFYTLLDELFK
jgi:thiol-disulfide isomerase/thioredoxin